MDSNNPLLTLRHSREGGNPAAHVHGPHDSKTTERANLIGSDSCAAQTRGNWIPAFAGMTIVF
jgi:hypothetical protein